MNILVVIDMQEKYMSMYDCDLVSRVNEKILDARDNNNLIIYVKNEGSTDDADSYNFADCLNIVSENIFEKHYQSAFSSKDFSDFIEKLDIQEVEIIGVDGRACVFKTAMDFANRGFNTKIILSCIGAKEDRFYDKAKETMKEAGIIIE